MKNKDEGYTGENEKWFQFNKRIVIRREEDDEAYLIRRTLVSFGKWFSIKYHQILESDASCMHCHPWGFLTFILKGGYYEWTPADQNDKGKVLAHRVSVDGETIEVKKWHGAGSIMYRPAKWRHRLELNTTFETKDNSIQLIPTHTLVFTFKTIRDWGFYTKNGWIFWRNYNQRRDC
jgi:hypothetical protein